MVALAVVQTFPPAATLALLVAAGCLWLGVDYGLIHGHAWLSAAFLLLATEHLLTVMLMLGLAPLSAVVAPLSVAILVGLVLALGRVVIGRFLYLLRRWVHEQLSTTGQ